MPTLAELNELLAHSTRKKLFTSLSLPPVSPKSTSYAAAADVKALEEEHTKSLSSRPYGLPQLQAIQFIATMTELVNKMRQNSEKPFNGQTYYMQLLLAALYLMEHYLDSPIPEEKEANQRLLQYIQKSTSIHREKPDLNPLASLRFLRNFIKNDFDKALPTGTKKILTPFTAEFVKFLETPLITTTEKTGNEPRTTTIPRLNTAGLIRTLDREIFAQSLQKFYSKFDFLKQALRKLTLPMLYSPQTLPGESYSVQSDLDATIARNQGNTSREYIGLLTQFADFIANKPLTGTPEDEQELDALSQALQGLIALIYMKIGRPNASDASKALAKTLNDLNLIPDFVKENDSKATDEAHLNRAETYYKAVLALRRLSIPPKAVLALRRLSIPPTEAMHTDPFLTTLQEVLTNDAKLGANFNDKPVKLREEITAHKKAIAEREENKALVEKLRPFLACSMEHHLLEKYQAALIKSDQPAAAASGRTSPTDGIKHIRIKKSLADSGRGPKMLAIRVIGNIAAFIEARIDNTTPVPEEFSQLDPKLFAPATLQDALVGAYLWANNYLHVQHTQERSYTQTAFETLVRSSHHSLNEIIQEHLATREITDADHIRCLSAFRNFIGNTVLANAAKLAQFTVEDLSRAQSYLGLKSVRTLTFSAKSAVTEIDQLIQTIQAAEAAASTQAPRAGALAVA